MNYKIGLDIGIGSIGWCVLSGKKEETRIEDFGTRIFESGEVNEGKDRLSQKRRDFRGIRRVIRRRAYRKELLKKLFQQKGYILSDADLVLEECRDEDVFKLKVQGLDKDISLVEILKCLIHTCNHRGYRDFYEGLSTNEEETDANDNDEEENETVNRAAVQAFETEFRASGKRTVSEYLMCNHFENGFVKFRNRSGGQEAYRLIGRNLLKEETELLLSSQIVFHPELSDSKEDILNILFSQRDFEDGPGNPENPYRRYHGFLETYGQCPFYPDDKRGCRSSVIADVFSVVNVLSQYTYANIETGDISFSRELGNRLLDSLLSFGNITDTDVKKICADMGYSVIISKNASDTQLGKSIRFLKTMKKALESAGENWNSWISEDQFDLDHPSRLHKLGILLSSCITPRRRLDNLKAEGFSSERLLSSLAGLKCGGTAGAGYRYMTEAIEAFRNGDFYGNYQANFNKAKEENLDHQSFKLPPQVFTDDEIKNNPVVFRSINETRKIVNAIVGRYGSPDEIIVEVADDLGKSYLNRQKETKQNREHEKETDSIRKQIANLLNLQDENKVTSKMIEKFRLYEQQEGKSLYSARPLGSLEEVLKDGSKVYEIDHIVPFSLILDNSLNNKALVFAEENQQKGQRTPLMYLRMMKSAEEEKTFWGFVNTLSAPQKKGAKGGKSGAKLSKKKYAYLTLPSIYGQDAEELLSGWKSRNINDTRYITKYIVSLLKHNLIFSEEGNHVYGVKGQITSRLRKIWLNDSVWGEDEKNRDSYLNHAVDATVVANLSPAYIEIASDAQKLMNLWKQYGRKRSPEYDLYLDSCIRKMEKYYHFSEEYTASLLRNVRSVPSLVKNLKAQIEVRFNDSDSEKFEQEVKSLYGIHPSFPFVVKPHMPVVSFKPEQKFAGSFSDTKPIKIVSVDGVNYKVSRKSVSDVKASELSLLWTKDEDLIKLFSSILSGKEPDYTIGEYMAENKIKLLRTSHGQPIRKVSIRSRNNFPNFYDVNKGENNRATLGNLRYYCVEVYKTKEGKTSLYGIRFVDVIKREGKLLQKEDTYPSDYGSHVMYLRPGDYFRVLDKKGSPKKQGTYQSVKSITEKRICFKKNTASLLDVIVGPFDTIEKNATTILGEVGGKVKCSVPFSSVKVKN